MITVSAKSTRRWKLASGVILAMFAVVPNFIVVTAVAAEADARLASMTGIWTGPPLGRKGVPSGFLLQGDIQVPVAATGLVLASTPGPDAWPDGVVPFQFDANVSSDNRVGMLVAMDEWMKGKDTNRLHVAFIPRGGQTNYIHIQNSDENNSPVGMSGGGGTINIHSWTETFVMAHELGHTLGLYHEQSRPDRDTYVNLHVENVKDGEEHNFKLYANWLAGTMSTPYDYSSVMQYGGCSFSKWDDCGSDHPEHATITGTQNQFLTSLGQRDHLTDSDYSDVYNVAAYGGGGSGYVDHRQASVPSQFRFGTLASPWASVLQGASTNASRQNPNPRSRLWVQGGTYAETGRLVGPQRILAIPGTGVVHIGP